MANFYNELDELFSSSKHEGQKNINTPEIFISKQASPNLGPDHDEIVGQMVNDAEIDKEVKIILNEQYNQSVGRELINSVFDIEQTIIKDEAKELKVTVEYDVSQGDCFSEQDQSLEVIVPKKNGTDLDLEWFMDGLDFKSDYFKRFEEEKRKALREKEAKEKRYYVEKVEPITDFSEYGDLADIFEEEHRQKMLEYKQNLDRVKKLKADDKQKEKIQKELQRVKLAKERSDRKVESTFKKLQSKMYLHGHYAKVIGFNDSQTMIKLSIPRTYHRLVDNCGHIIVTSPFIELSSSKPMFYYYSLKQQMFFLYGKSPSDKEYTLMYKSSTQEEMWEAIKKVEPVNYAGFSFHKFELFDSARFY